MKTLTIVSMGDGRFCYQLENGTGLTEGGTGLDWVGIKQILRKIEPATALGNEYVAMASAAVRSSFSAQAQCGPWASAGARMPSEYDRLVERVRALEQIVHSNLGVMKGNRCG